MVKIILGIMVLFLGACGAKDSTRDNEEKIVNIAVPIEIVDLDPFGVQDVHSMRVRDQVFETLFAVNSSGQIIPELALSFTNINDTTIQMTLRSNVLFHDGEKFTAEDVKYSFDRALETASHQSILDPVKVVTVVSPYVIRITLKDPYAPIQMLLSSSVAFIVSKKAAEAGNPQIGTGPFTLSEWNKGQNLILEKFYDYWGEKAKVDKINLKIVPEALVRMIAVETGEIDIAYDIDYIEKQRVLDTPELRFGEATIPRIEYLGFQTSKYPFDNILLRQAISYALDIPGILNTALSGAGEQAYSLSIPGIGHTKASLVQQDKEKAKQLLKESGLPVGTKISILAIEGVRKGMAEVIQANLKEIGIDLEINIVEWAKYAQQMYAVDTGMFLGGWGNEPDADLFYSVFFNTASKGPGGNFTGYSDIDMDILLEKARKEQDTIKRQEYYDQIHNKSIEERVMIPLYYPINTIVYRTNIKQMRFDTYGLNDWNTIEME